MRQDNEKSWGTGYHDASLYGRETRTVTLPKSCLFRRLRSHAPVCAAVGLLRLPANATPVHPAACGALAQVRVGVGTVFLPA